VKRTVLFEEHQELGASFVEFGGWEMPVRYTSDLAEHHSVRKAAGLFDISHMAEFEIYGPEATEFLDYAVGGKPSTIAENKAKYQLLLSEEGGIVDDLIIYHWKPGRYLLVANAGNHDAVAEALKARSANFQVTIDDITDAYSLIALQGPRSLEILQNIPSLIEGIEGVAEMKYYSGTFMRFKSANGRVDVELFVARTGYTGEDGFEIYVPNDFATFIWRALLAHGEELGLNPAGLAARDTLRLEAGMPLYGHELGLDIHPAAVNLERTVAFDKADFVGKAALQASAAPTRKLIGLRAEGKRAPRAGYPVMHGEKVVGEVTSGVLSPTLGYPIAMALIDIDAIDADLTVDIRGTALEVSRVELPFYKRQK